MNRAVFIERDGILNEISVAAASNGGLHSFAEFHVKTEAIELVRQLKVAGFLVIATTNQPGLSRGTLPRRELDAMHEALRGAMPLDDILVCPHDADDDCSCRKPRPGLFIEAAFKHHIDLNRSFVISERWQDASAAHSANCTSILLRSQFNGKCHHDIIRDDLSGILAEIIGVPSHRRLRVG
jgi:D-glycero-D-manno-heptose 1,7-bisphosphate phosphatase